MTRIRRAFALAIACVALSASVARAQHDEHREWHGDDHFRSPHWVYDSHHHLNQYYPPRGQVVATLPPGAVAVTVGGAPLYFHGGVWFRPSGPRYVVVAPPPGVIVPVLPPAYATVWVAGRPYYYANGVYYALASGGYAVVAPPPGVDPNAPPPVTVAGPPPAPSIADLVVYPRQGQSPQQTESDRTACAQWATPEAAGKDASVYQRAMSACMDARGYTVR